MTPFNFFRSPRPLTSEPLGIEDAIRALAVADAGEWVIDGGDERAWTLKAALVMQSCRIRLFDALTSGKVKAYVQAPHEPGFRLVDADYWRRGNRGDTHLSLQAAIDIVPTPKLTACIVGPGVPQEVEGLPIQIMAEDLAPLSPGPAAEVSQRACSQPRPVSEAELTTWVRDLLKKGYTGREVEKARATGFPGHELPSRRRVAARYADLHARDFGELPKPGAMHPLLARRRTSTSNP